MRVAGATALVTGASRGIGRTTAVALAAAGADVALAARTVDDLERVAREVERLGRRALVVPADLTDEREAAAIVPRVTAAWGRVDILVANAGAYITCPVLELTAAEVERALRINFYGSLHPILALLPQLVERRRGHVVVVGSIDGRRPLPGDGPYAIAKTALTGLVQVLRQELRPLGVGVTGVYPGRVETAMIADLNVPWISRKMPAERVARAIVHAIEHERAEVIVPRAGRLLVCLDAVSPRASEALVARLGLRGRWNRTPSTARPPDPAPGNGGETPAAS